MSDEPTPPTRDAVTNWGRAMQQVQLNEIAYIRDIVIAHHRQFGNWPTAQQIAAKLKGTRPQP